MSTPCLIETESPMTPAPNGERRYAIVGMGCRLPGDIDSPASFWKLLTEGRDAIVDVPPDRGEWRALYDPDPSAPGRIYAQAGGFLKGVDQFDPGFFGISPREAARIDPQQRLLLEVVWHAFEDANIPIDTHAGKNTGVFVGISTHDYADVQMYPENRSSIDAHSNTGGASSIAANRISYVYDFRGPSLSVDTACSSALTAVHLACRAIENHDCDVAVACGVQLALRPELTIGFCRATMISVDNRCKAFDAAANGYVRSEGAGAVILKSLARALEDGDTIYAVVLGSAINQDGHSSGLTVPSQASQEAMLRLALRRADVRANEIQYVEAHGTGTPVGDPIEARAIGTVFREERAEGNALWIGSVKTNIGHIEAASGIAGLIKTVLSLHHRKIPACLHFQQWNPEIDADTLKIRVPRSIVDWPGNAADARAVVNSFGFGGANASVVLASGPSYPQPSCHSERAELLTLSARSDEALRALAIHSGATLRSTNAAPAAFCGNAALGRMHLHHRLAVVGASREALADALESFAMGETTANIVSANLTSGTPRRLAFVFSGLGPQWWAMGRQLLASEPAFASMLERCDAALRPLSVWSLIDEFRADEASSRLTHPRLAQVSNFALQVALFNLYASWGIHPDAVMGHSGGAMAAAYVAGVHSLEDAIRVAFHRSDLQGRQSMPGAMLAVGLPHGDLAAILRGIENLVSLAAVNSPNAMTLSGDPAALSDLSVRLVERNVFARMLPMTIAYHSAAMDPIRDEFLARVAGLRGEAARLPLVSDTTGTWVTDFSYDAGYWWDAIRRPVLFAQGVDTLLDAGYTSFLELSPHPVLATSINECMAARKLQGLVVSSLRRNEDERTNLLRSLASLHVNGVSVDFQSLYRREPGVSLALYPWQRERHWFESTTPDISLETTPFANDPHPLLSRRLRTALPTWETRLDNPALAYLDDHVVRSAVLFPAAGYIEIALTAALRLDSDSEIALRDVEFFRPLTVADRRSLHLQIVINPDHAGFNIYARTTDEDAWTHHVRGRISRRAGLRASTHDMHELRNRVAASLDPNKFYEGMHARGLHYGPTFKGVRRLHVGAGDTVGVIGPCEELEVAPYIVHPALLDAALQLLAATVGERTHDDRLFLPTRIEEVRLHRPASEAFLARCVHRYVSDNEVVGAVELVDEGGEPLISVRGVHVQFVESRSADIDELDECLYEYRWEAQVIRGGEPGSPRRCVLPSPISGWSGRASEDVAHLQRQTDWPRYYTTIEQLLSEIAANHVLDAFLELGLADPLQSTISKAAIDSLRTREPSRGAWTRRLLALLEQTGVLRTSADGWSIHRAGPVDIVSDDLRPYTIDVELLAQSARTLSGALEGDGGRSVRKDAAFTIDALPLLARFYADAPASAFYNRLLATAITHLAGRANRGGCLRVLEVGAGTGGTTHFLLEALPCEHLHYVCTDAATLLVEGLRERFGALPFMDVRLFDLTGDAADQGIAVGSFDLVIAANVVHATPDVRAALQQLHTLLAPDGILGLIEITRAPLWLDVIFGQTKGWWAFADRTLRPDYPLLPAAVWQDLLHEHNFEDVVASCEPNSSGEAAQTVFLARATAAKSLLANWMIFGPDAALTDSLRVRLESLGQTVLASSADDYPTALVDAAIGSSIVLVLEANATEAETTTFASTKAALALMQSVASHAHRFTGGLWIITQGTSGLDVQIEDGLFQTPVWGLARALMKEHPTLPIRLVDLSPVSLGAEMDALTREMTERSAEEEIALRGDRRYVRRLRRTTRASLPTRVSGSSQPNLEWRAEVGLRGSLASLRFAALTQTELAPDEIRIDVRAGSLNFRDVMLAMGGIPTSGDEPSFGRQQIGSDCAGVVTAVGNEVTEFCVGDEVMAMAAGSLGSSTSTSALLACQKPASLSFAEAASLPTAFLTVWYALVHLARLQPGERLLVHAATGGVGLAAIQVASLIGAEVFATAGSPQKREYLASIGIDHVMDSRTLAFADEIRERTTGRGVDVVLNSLTGEAIERGIASLAPYGRFVEIGKRDIYANRNLGLEPFRRNLAFLSLDLDRLCAEKPQSVHGMLGELSTHFASGALVPPPLQRFDLPDIENAFRFMAQTKHIGKVVLTRDVDGPLPPIIPVEPDLRIRNDATYLISGGLGGFGLEVADWLVERGAGAIVLMGRHPPTASTQERLARMTARGTRVEVVLGDASGTADVQSAMRLINRTLPRLVGVFHAAMVLDDRRFEHLDVASLERVLAPKARGAWVLHQQTRHCKLDMFVLFSSIASLLGNAAQGNYGAASAFLDALSHYRRATGLPSLTINWGVLAGAGYVAARPELEARLSQQGYRSFSLRKALDALACALTLDVPQIMIARVDWRRVADYAPNAAASPRIADLVPREEERGRTAVPTSEILARLAAATASERRALLEPYLCEALGRVLGLAASEIDRERPIDELGLDSLLAVEFAMVLTRELGVDLPVISLLGGMSTTRLAGLLLADIPVSGTKPPVSPRPAGLPNELAVTATAPEPPDDRPSPRVHPARPPELISQVESNGSIDYAKLDYSRWSPLQQISRRVSQFAFFCVANVEILGVENLPTSGPYILAVNHLSMADVPLALTILRRRAIILATPKLRKSRVLDWLVGRVGQAIYTRHNDESMKSLDQALTVLNHGGVIALAPEGTRSKSGLLKGQTGVSWLAERSGVPVIPYAAWGQERWRARFRQWGRLTIHVRIGAPIAMPSDVAAGALPVDFTRRVMLAVAHMLPPAYRGVYADAGDHAPTERSVS